MTTRELKDGALQLIARECIDAGLEMLSPAELAFTWSETVNDITFQLKIEKIDATFQTLPLVTLTEWPQAFSKNAPHVLGSDNALCYLDRLGSYFDPFEPARCIQQILSAVQQTLLILTDEEKRERDYGLEFGVYWKPEYLAFLTTEKTDAQAVICKPADSKNEEGGREELVIYSDEPVLKCWLEKRSLEKNSPSHPVIFIQLKEPPCIPPDYEWPVGTWKSFMRWLFQCHPGAENHVLQKMVGAIQSSLTVCLVFNHLDSGPFGVLVAFNKSILNVLKRYSGKRKNLAQFRTSLISPTYTSRFSRLYIGDVTETFQIERNLRTASLKGKRIAVVGCGTVGAHVANLLVKSGAATGEGSELRLYDDDTLKPANLGRHLLGIEYLCKKKSNALADYLNDKFIFSLNVSAKDKFTRHGLADVLDFDLIIDATGDEQFSTVLAYDVHRLRQSGHALKVLHTWVDANGLAARALLDDGTGGCYRCLKIYDNDPQKGLKERFQLFDKDTPPEFAHANFRCGESYMPFSEGVSLASAGLTLQMVLDYFSDEPAPRFRHLSLHSSVKPTKSQNLKTYPKCPCCNHTTS